MATYRERCGPPGLTGRIACVWSMAPGPPPAASVAADDPGHLVLPDGCVDLVWNAEELIVAGPDTGPTLVPRAHGTTVGVRLRPGAAADVLGEAAASLRDQRISAADLWGRRGAELAERVADADGAPARAALLVAVVGARIVAAPRRDATVAEAVRLLGRGSASVAGVAAAVALSERQLRRRFLDHVGYGPKTLDRVLRLQRFLDLAAREAAKRERSGAWGPAPRAAGPVGLAGLAAAAGYADQSHLNRDVSALAGRTPVELLRVRGLLAPE